MSADGWISRKRDRWLVPVAVFVGAFLLVALTASDYGVTWDEPPYFHAADLEVQWLAQFWSNLLDGRPGESLNDDVIRKAWHWDPFHVEHPPVSRFLSGVSHALFSPPLDKFLAYRLPMALFFAVLVTVLYLWMAAVFDRTTGLFAALLLVLMPNLFGQAHFVMTDMPLAVLWFLSVYCFWKGLQDWKWSLALGVAWGLALATKFPAFAIPIPLLLWAHLYHRRSYSNNVFAMVFLSPAVMVLCNPYLWHKTLVRLAQFVHHSASRGFREGIQVLFFNEYYPSSAVPWYYPFVMTAVTIPEVTLAFALFGAVAWFWLKSRRDVLALFLLNAAMVFMMGLLPGGVLHDVNRLLLPALPFLACLAGCGFFVGMRYLTERVLRVEATNGIRHLRMKLVAVVFALTVIPPAFDVLAYHPYELSYYNRLVGGIRGAYQRGLEVTYLMEAYTPDFLRFLNRELQPNAVINASFSNFMFKYLQKENRLRADIRITEGSDFDYFIQLNRASILSREDRAALAAPPFFPVWTLDGVPLVLMEARTREK
jgi:4-amino-4-deoxy-L-arabinose transferase-like glycosyltransferase